MRERNHMGLHLENEVARRVAYDHQVVKTPKIIPNNPVYAVSHFPRTGLVNGEIPP